MAEEIHLRWMKSLRDEICLSAGDGADLVYPKPQASISSEAARRRFHPSPARISSCVARFHSFRVCRQIRTGERHFLIYIPHRSKSVDRFEPPQCRGDSRIALNRITAVGAFIERPRATNGRPYTFKIYLQSRRCNRGLDRFGLPKHLKCLQSCGIMKVRRR